VPNGDSDPTAYSIFSEDCSDPSTDEVPPGSPAQFTSLGAGKHTLAVKQVDKAGNQSAASATEWTVDLTPPGAPVLSGTPAASTRRTTATIGFSGEQGASFSCSVDGGSFLPCSSPKALTGLAEGAHTFAVRQTDENGNTGPAASYGWTVDRTPPSAPVLSGVPPAFTNLRTASISFTAATDKVFQCSVDGKPFAACASPLRLSDLTEGSHSVVVRHNDAAWNFSSVTATWRVDVTPPGIWRDARRSKSTNGQQTTYALAVNKDRSGIAKAEYSTTFRPSATARPVTERTVQITNPVVFRTSSTIKAIRIQDGAGNWSRWYIG
jgi:hypothetical protein